jgi:hypothetical protein
VSGSLYLSVVASEHRRILTIQASIASRISLCKLATAPYLPLPGAPLVHEESRRIRREAFSKIAGTSGRKLISRLCDVGDDDGLTMSLAGGSERETRGREPCRTGSDVEEEKSRDELTVFGEIKTLLASWLLAAY